MLLFNMLKGRHSGRRLTDGLESRKLCSYVSGCSVCFLGGKGLIKLAKVLKPLNSSSNLICNSEMGDLLAFVVILVQNMLVLC